MPASSSTSTPPDHDTSAGDDHAQGGTPAIPEAFKALGLRDSVLRGIAAMGFDTPTDIQVELIPKILAGADVIGQARTGTGKTAAFGLPILHLADEDTPMQALILTPTRELAAQVAGEIEDLGRDTPIKAACIVGGESMRRQQRDLERGAHLIVGTPGRVMDLKGRGQISFDNIRFAVLDEVDRMLDIGFRDDIRKILGAIKRDHQTIFVSATLDDQIEALARKFMKDDAEKVNVVSGSLTVQQVDQHYFSVEPWDKRALLLKLMQKEKPDTTLVFCRTKATVRKITQYLRDKGLGVREIHGDLHQKKRNSVMETLRDRKVDVVIASDLAARGLDVDHITHVINYDLPEDPEIYVHRIGRTARAGRRGVAWSFVTPDQGQLLTEIEKHSGALIAHMEYPDFKPGRVPDDIRQQREIDEKRRSNPSPTLGDRVVTSGGDTGGMSEEQLKRLFPSGVIPKGGPRKTLGGKFKRRGRR